MCLHLQADVTRDAKRTRLPLSSCLALLRLSLFDTGVFLSVAKAIQTHIASASPLDPQQEATVVQVPARSRGCLLFCILGLFVL